MDQRATLAPRSRALLALSTLTVGALGQTQVGVDALGGTSAAGPTAAQCTTWAEQGECKSNPSYMMDACAAACGGQAAPPKEAADTDPHCSMWAEKGECEKNAAFMAAGCSLACRRHTTAKKDKDPKCAEWAAKGDCDERASFMHANCKTACERALGDQLDDAACADLSARGGCATAEGLAQCRGSCLTSLHANLTSDTEGNCWYWGTDGECTNNSVWMRKTCPRSCEKLDACSAAHTQHTDACAAAFECPPARDERHDCVARARRGECRAADAWGASSLVKTCSTSCHLLDPPSVSRTAMRPIVRRSALVDAPPLFSVGGWRHAPSRCGFGAPPQALLDDRCPAAGVLAPARVPAHQPLAPALTRRALPWRRARCPRLVSRMTPRLPHPAFGSDAEARAAADALAAAAPPPQLSPPPPPRRGRPSPAHEAAAAAGAWDASRVWVQTVYESPRVRLVHQIVSPQEALALIELGASRFHRSTTARAGSDDYRTSESAMLPGSEPVVRALRQRMAHLMGYPVASLEPLQVVRYTPGQYYKPHHDFYNACETWLDGNRHFTFLVYLNAVTDGGGQTGFPRLNLTVEPTAYSALLFNNCLDNGEPDERTQHEGIVPTHSTKYAINGWMRSKASMGRRS